MYPDTFQKSTSVKKMSLFQKRGSGLKEAGVALVTAVYLLIIVAGGVLLMSSLMNMQNTATVLSMEGFRARLAAYSGLEWMQFHLRNGSDCTGSPFNVRFRESELVDYSVSVDCVAQVYTEESSQVTLYELTATATKGTFGATDYVSRDLSMTLEF